MSIDDLSTIKTERPTHLSAETLAELEDLLNEERRGLIEPADDPNSITDLADDPGTRLSERQMLDQMSSATGRNAGCSRPRHGSHEVGRLWNV